MLFETRPAHTAWLNRIRRSAFECRATAGRPGEGRQDYLAAGCTTGLEGERSVGARVSLPGISSNEIFGSIGQREWIPTIQKNKRMRQRIFQPPSNSPASSAVTADGRPNLLRCSKNTSMNDLV